MYATRAEAIAARKEAKRRWQNTHRESSKTRLLPDSQGVYAHEFYGYDNGPHYKRVQRELARRRRAGKKDYEK